MTRSRHWVPAYVHVIVAAVLGAVAGGVAAFASSWQLAVLVGWDVAAAVFLAAIIGQVHHMSPEDTKARARREDPSTAIADPMLLIASVSALVGVLLAILKASNAHGNEKALLIGLALFTVVASWALVHTLFMLRYARLYYGETPGGIDFAGGDKEPTYGDFAYVAFTIGMCYQVSDTDLTSKAIRHTALRQSFLAYLFGTVIIAVTINVVAGLAG